MSWVIKHVPTGAYLKDSPYREKDVCLYLTKAAASRDMDDCLHSSVKKNYKPVKVRRKPLTKGK